MRTLPSNLGRASEEEEDATDESATASERTRGRVPSRRFEQRSRDGRTDQRRETDREEPETAPEADLVKVFAQAHERRSGTTDESTLGDAVNDHERDERTRRSAPESGGDHREEGGQSRVKKEGTSSKELGGGF